MQNIPHCTDIQGDHSWLRFWTLKDFQPDFAVKQVETDHNRKTNYCVGQESESALFASNCHSFSADEYNANAFENAFMLCG